MVQAVTVGVPSWNDLGGSAGTGSPITVIATQFPGATAGDKINAAIASLPASGGIVDATGFTGAQTIGSTILVNKPTQLLFGCATFAGSINPLIEIAVSNCVITSEFCKCACFHQTTPPGNGIKIDAGVNHTLIENICAENTGPLPIRPTGQNQQYIPIWAAGSSSQSVEDLTVRHCLIGNGSAQMVLEWTNNSRIVKNEFVAVAPSTPGSGVPGIADAIVVAGSHNLVDGNNFQTTGNVSTIILLNNPAVNFNQFTGANYNVVTNNLLDALTALNNEAIIIIGAHNTIGHNTLNLASMNSTSGINLYPASVSSIPQHTRYNSIVGNTIDIADGNFSGAAQLPGGIAIFNNTSYDSLDYNVISGNTISSPGVPLICAGGSHNVFSGNVASVTGGTNGADVMQIGGLSTPTADVVVIGNTLQNSTGFAAIDIGSGATGLYIEGNRIIGNPTTLTNGIATRPNSAANSHFGGNAFSTNLNWGIYLDPAVGSNISIGLNHFLETDIHLGDINISTNPSSVTPASAGHIRIISDTTAGVGVTVLNSVTANRTWSFQDATDTFVGRQTSDTLSNKTLVYPIINQGIDPQTGTGFKRNAMNFGTIAANATLDVHLPWLIAMPDANYMALPSVTDNDNTGLLAVWGIHSVTAASINVLVHNNDSVTGHAGLLQAIAIHY